MELIVHECPSPRAASRSPVACLWIASLATVIRPGLASSQQAADEGLLDLSARRFRMIRDGALRCAGTFRDL